MIKCNYIKQITWITWNVARQIHGWNTLTGEILWPKTYKKIY